MHYKVYSILFKCIDAAEEENVKSGMDVVALWVKATEMAIAYEKSMLRFMGQWSYNSRCLSASLCTSTSVLKMKWSLGKF